MTPSIWYKVAPRVEPDVDAVTAFTVACVEELGEAGLVICRPEVWTVSREWDPALHFDGRRVGLDEARTLVRSMLEDGRFWCALESDRAAVHVGDGVVYLGLPGPLPESGVGSDSDVVVSRIDESPWRLDRPSSSYPAADDDYWDRVIERASGSVGPLLVVRVWAGGIGGEHWYRVTGASDVGRLRAERVPRSIYGAFGPEVALAKTVADSVGMDAFLGPEPLMGAVRVLLPRPGGPRLAVRVPSDEDELAAEWDAAPEGSLLFAWFTEETRLIPAAEADEDGVVRTPWAFDMDTDD